MSDWHVFPNGTSFMMWRDSNCDRCKKDFCEDKPGHKNGHNPDCPIEEAISLSSVLDGRIHPEQREEIGKRLKWNGRTYLEHNCPEFEEEL